jgi:hypothetical protein
MALDAQAMEDTPGGRSADLLTVFRLEGSTRLAGNSAGSLVAGGRFASYPECMALMLRLGDLSCLLESMQSAISF